MKQSGGGVEWKKVMVECLAKMDEEVNFVRRCWGGEDGGVH